MGNDPAPKSLTTSQQIATTLAPSRGRDQEITKTAHHPKPVDHAQTERDVAALVTEFFAAVSFEPGSGPHYEAIRTLFIDEGILVKKSQTSPTYPTSMVSSARARRWSSRDKLTELFEGERTSVTEVFGKVTHRFSSYEKRGVTNGVVAEARAPPPSAEYVDRRARTSAHPAIGAITS